MKKISIALALALAVAGMAASAAAGAAVRPDLVGKQVPSEQAQRTIVITPTTKYVNVTEDDVVKFVDNGKSFTWDFDSAVRSSFPLNSVAPAGMLDHTVIAYVESTEQG